MSRCSAVRGAAAADNMLYITYGGALHSLNKEKKRPPYLRIFMRKDLKVMRRGSHDSRKGSVIMTSGSRL